MKVFVLLSLHPFAESVTIGGVARFVINLHHYPPKNT
jgi:hypothetical protein